MCWVCTHSVFCVKKEPVARSSLQKWLWLNMEFVINYHAIGAPLVDRDSSFNISWKTIVKHTNFQIKCWYPRCRRVYKSESEYKRHYKVHTTEFQDYTCTTCGKSCSIKKNLDKHMALHRDILRFQCKNCGKKFRWRSSLSIHMKCKHPPTPPPPSDHCGKSPSPEF